MWADNKIQEIHDLHDGIEVGNVENNELKKAQEVLQDPQKRQQAIDYLKQDQDKIAAAVKDNMDEMVLKEAMRDDANGENPYKWARDLHEQLFGPKEILQPIWPQPDKSTEETKEKKELQETNDLQEMITMLKEWTDINTQAMIDELAANFNRSAKNLFWLDYTQLRTNIANNLDKKMSRLKDIFVNEQAIADKIVNMTQKSFESYLTKEKTDAFVCSMFMTMIERMHTTLKGKWILANKTPDSKRNKEKIIFLSNLSKNLSWGTGTAAMESIWMDVKAIRANMNAIGNGIYSDLNTALSSESNGIKKIQQWDPSMQQTFDDAVARHLDQIMDSDAAKATAKIRSISKLPADPELAKASGAAPEKTLTEISKARRQEIIQWTPQTADELKEVKAILKEDAIGQKREKIEKFLSDLWMDKWTLQKIFFKDDWTPTTLWILVAGLLNITGNGNFDSLKKMFNIEGGKLDAKQIADNSWKVLDTYTKAQQVTWYVKKPAKDIWPNETFGATDETLKTQITNIDTTLLFNAWKEQKINLNTLGAEYKKANPDKLDASGKLVNNSENEKDLQKFILTNLTEKLQKAHTENSKIDLPSDEKWLVAAITTLAQGWTLTEKAAATSTSTTEQNKQQWTESPQTKQPTEQTPTTQSNTTTETPKAG